MKQYTIDDCWHAARIDIAKEWRVRLDEYGGMDWTWALDVLATLDNTPDAIDGHDGSDSTSLRECIMDEWGI